MKKETRISFIELLPSNILRIELKVDIELGLDDLDENLCVYQELLGNKKGYFLVIFEENGRSNLETRSKFANRERAKIKAAEALVISNLAHRIESNHYKNSFKPNHPVKVFSQEKEATDWLLSLIKKEKESCNQ